MGRGRKPAKQLSYRDKKIVEQYNATSHTMPRLARRYGITKQRVYEILIRAKKFGYVIRRQKLSGRYHDFHQCEICHKILRKAEKEDLMTRRQLGQILNVEDRVCHWHLNQLKRAGCVSKEFATIRSDRLVAALQCYKNDSLSKNAVGRRFGYKNFHSMLSYQKKKGLNVERMLKSPVIADLEQGEGIAPFSSMGQTGF